MTQPKLQAACHPYERLSQLAATKLSWRCMPSSCIVSSIPSLQHIIYRCCPEVSLHSSPKPSLFHTLVKPMSLLFSLKH